MIIGKDVVLNITAPCTRCVMITLLQGDLPSDLGILSTVAKYNEVHVVLSIERIIRCAPYCRCTQLWLFVVLVSTRA